MEIPGLLWSSPNIITFHSDGVRADEARSHLATRAIPREISGNPDISDPTGMGTGTCRFKMPYPLRYAPESARYASRMIKK